MMISDWVHLYFGNIRRKPNESVLPYRERDIFELDARSVLYAYSSDFEE